jgi:NAD-dependent SIR2 family protein deacetylase
MNEAPCSQCGRLWEKDELLKREDNDQLICPECSGLLADEDLSCRYDESG